MDTQPQTNLQLPSIDIPYYLSHASTYFIDHLPLYYSILKSVMGVLVGICIPICIFLVFAIVITVENLKHIRKLEEVKFGAEVEPAYTEEKADPELAKRWRAVLEHVDSQNPNDWKQAIIEADVLLENLVTKLGYRGESLGEKLKRATKGDFKTKDAAWDAHMVRNRIAHDGSAYDLNQLEAKHVIGLYRQVFEEFYHISN